MRNVLFFIALMVACVYYSMFLMKNQPIFDIKIILLVKI